MYSDPNDHLNELVKKRDELITKRDRLIENLKTQHRDFYKWLVETEISPLDLGKYTINTAAVFTIALGVLSPEASESKTDPPADQVQQIAQPVRIITREELKGLSDDEKAQLVWQRYGHIINRVAGKYRVDPKLILATIMLESGGDARAIRSEPRIDDASYGLGQILYGTAKSIGFEGKSQDLFDPEVNIDLIGKYHRRNQDSYGGNLTAQQLTIAYNTGSPNNNPLPGHLVKFNKWYDKVSNLIT